MKLAGLAAWEREHSTFCKNLLGLKQSQTFPVIASATNFEINELFLTAEKSEVNSYCDNYFSRRPHRRGLSTHGNEQRLTYEVS